MADARGPLVAAVKATDGKGAAAWLALLRHDYSCVVHAPSAVAWGKLLRSYVAARSAIAKDATQSQAPEYTVLLLDEVRVQL